MDRREFIRDVTITTAGLLLPPIPLEVFKKKKIPPHGEVVFLVEDINEFLNNENILRIYTARTAYTLKSYSIKNGYGGNISDLRTEIFKCGDAYLVVVIGAMEGKVKYYTYINPETQYSKAQTLDNSILKISNSLPKMSSQEQLITNKIKIEILKT